jgi:hypothetical protein
MFSTKKNNSFSFLCLNPKFHLSLVKKILGFIFFLVLGSRIYLIWISELSLFIHKFTFIINLINFIIKLIYHIISYLTWWFCQKKNLMIKFIDLMIKTNMCMIKKIISLRYYGLGQKLVQVTVLHKSHLCIKPFLATPCPCGPIFFYFPRLFEWDSN